MTYWKFLRPGPMSPFTGHIWAPGEWMSVPGTGICVQGFHACRVADLPYWLGEELWQIDLAEPVTAAPHKVVAARARLISQVEAWTPATARELATACVGRTAKHAADELAEQGLTDAANRLTQVVTKASPPDWIDTARDCAEAASKEGARQALKLSGYVIDAVEALTVYPVATLAYIAARAANQRSSADSGDPYAAERTWQADWLARRLGLAASA